jgi:hypothetical protein
LFFRLKASWYKYFSQEVCFVTRLMIPDSCRIAEEDDQEVGAAAAC